MVEQSSCQACIAFALLHQPCSPMELGTIVLVAISAIETRKKKQGMAKRSHAMAVPL
jgi:hypothetical protein